MSEYQPIPITVMMVNPNAELGNQGINPYSPMADDRREAKASAERACTLANNAEFQQRVPIDAWRSIKSETADRETKSAWLGAKNDFLEWLKDFPDASGTSESERLMACMAVLEAMGEGKMA